MIRLLARVLALAGALTAVAPLHAAPSRINHLPEVARANDFRPSATTPCVKRSTHFRPGHYDNPVLLTRLQETRNFYQIHEPEIEGPPFAFIDSNGTVEAGFWTEGGDAQCGYIHNGQLWLKHDAGKMEPEWFGPYVYTGNRSVDKVYFHYLFGDACYQADSGESWCFDRKGIKIAGVHRAARLYNSSGEEPTFGNPVVLEVFPLHRYWVFVPDGKGWKVYRHTWSENNPGDKLPKGKPWKTLKPAAVVGS